MDRRRPWLLSMTMAVLCPALLVLSEWLFFVTKPSFLSGLTWSERIGVLLASIMPPTLPLVAVALMLWGLRTLLSGRGEWLLLFLAALLPGATLAVLMALLFDNFTLTILSTGLRDVSWPHGLWYLAALGVLSVVLAARTAAYSRRAGDTGFWGLTAVGLMVAAGSLAAFVTARPAQAAADPESSVMTGRPNILLIGGDGLNATHLSVYGYGRRTTPFLEKLAVSSLVAENAFSNAGPTGASLTSIWTGKLATETRVVFPPDILRGQDVFQHLPGILRMRGYRSGLVSIRHYADAFDLNLRGGFDFANGRSLARDETLHRLLLPWGHQTGYFLQTVYDRLYSRGLHLAGIEPMEDPFLEVASQPTSFRRDRQRLEDLLEFIDDGPQPFFAHVHLLVTHGPTFRPSHRIFSEGQEQTSNWMLDFYDDAVLDFDAMAAELVEALESRGLLDSTLLILYSDHPRRYRIWDRIPLLIRFPGGQPAGRIRANVQLIDLAPTILDFLNLPRPDWMGGRSLLTDELPSDRPLFGAQQNYAEQERGETGIRIKPDAITPPFFTMRYTTMVVCGNWYRLDLVRNRLETGVVDGHTGPCPTSLGPEEARVMLLEHLRSRGFDVSDIDRPDSW
jgi:arylsulfatase A-like enzyme